MKNISVGSGALLVVTVVISTTRACDGIREDGLIKIIWCFFFFTGLW